MELVTPGVRPEWFQAKGDQKRTVTPRDAILAGADRLVMGRPITKSDDPRAAIERTLEEIELALQERTTAGG